MSNATITPAAIARQRHNGLQNANRVRHQRRLLRGRIARLTPPDGAAMAGRVHSPSLSLPIRCCRSCAKYWAKAAPADGHNFFENVVHVTRLETYEPHFRP